MIGSAEFRREYGLKIDSQPQRRTRCTLPLPELYADSTFIKYTIGRKDNTMYSILIIDDEPIVKIALRPSCLGGAWLFYLRNGIKWA